MNAENTGGLPITMEIEALKRDVAAAVNAHAALHPFIIGAVLDEARAEVRALYDRAAAMDRERYEEESAGGGNG